jgi:hypothetical protein
MAVERSRWTDDRLDTLAEQVMRHDVLEVRMGALERSFSDFRTEMRAFHLELKAELKDLRADLGGQISGLRNEITGVRDELTGLRGEAYASKRWMITLWITGVLALLAVLVELSIRT